MEERLISFETACLAKEKGFNIQTAILPYMLDGNNIGKRGFCISCTSYTNCSTQSLLQKWLREVHKIDINIECFVNDDGETIYDYVVYYVDAPKVDWEDGPWLIYEDCLEIALNRGLNYIIK